MLLYPAGHPAIAATLGRIVQITSPGALTEPLKITVLPDGLLLDERAPARPEGALSELAALLHSHLIGELTVHPGGDIEAWRTFLLLLGRTPESVRADGGIARVWTTMAGRHLELREIDYAEVLRERASGQHAVWDRVVANCLQGNAFELDEAAINDLISLAGNPDQLCDLMSTVESKMETAGGIGAKTAAVLRMLRGIIDVVSKNAPDRLEPILQNMAAAVGQLSPEMLLGLLEKRRSADEGAQVVQAVISRMSDRHDRGVRRASRHRSELADRSPRAGVPGPGPRPGTAGAAACRSRARNVAASPLGSTEGFEDVWNHVAQKLLTSYTDESFVSDEYGRELSGARTQAVDVERVSDDPPERVSAWLGTIATSALRSLDLHAAARPAADRRRRRAMGRR